MSYNTVIKNSKTVPGTAALTFKGQIAKESGKEIHGVHDEDGDVGHLLHPLLRWTKIREMKVE